MAKDAFKLLLVSQVKLITSYSLSRIVTKIKVAARAEFSVALKNNLLLSFQGNFPHTMGLPGTNFSLLEPGVLCASFVRLNCICKDTF